MLKLLRFFTVNLLLIFSLGVFAAGQPDINEIKPAAEQGDALAQAKMGAIYYLGKGVMQDRKEAAQWMKKSADQGFIEAMVVVAAMYDVGLGVDRDPDESTAWYKKAAAKGHEPSQGILNYYKGVERSIKATRIASQYSKEILRKK